VNVIVTAYVLEILKLLGRTPSGGCADLRFQVVKAAGRRAQKNHLGRALFKRPMVHQAGI
jgi:hypothetical protein